MHDPRSPLANGWHGDAVLTRLGELDADEARRRRLLATACCAAVLLHAALALLVPRPAVRSELQEVARTVLQLSPAPRFRKPPPVDVAPTPPARRIPMPDPTPDELEPLVTAAPPAPSFEVPIDPGVDAIPSPPPPAPTVYEVGGDVSAPVKLFAPDPLYPRIALLARRGGAVVVEATIDREGRVTAARALTSRGFGLEDAALVAIADWRFEPALRHGEPVPVLYRLTVNFAVAP